MCSFFKISDKNNQNTGNLKNLSHSKINAVFIIMGVKFYS